MFSRDTILAFIKLYYTLLKFELVYHSGKKYQHSTLKGEKPFEVAFKLKLATIMTFSFNYNSLYLIKVY